MREKRLALVWFTVIAALFLGAAVSRGAGVELGSITQVSGSTDVVAGLVTQGLRAATSNPPLGIGTGAITAGDHLATDSTNVHVGGTTVATDVATGAEYLQSQNAYAQASTNPTGASLYLSGGIGSTFYTVVTASALSGATFTVSVNETSTVLTDGSSFTHSATDSVEATNLAGAFSGITGISATAVGAVVYVTPTSGTYFVNLQTNASSANATATNGAASSIVVGSQLVRAPSGQGLIVGGNSSTNPSLPSGFVAIQGQANNAVQATANGGDLLLGGGMGQATFHIITFGSITGNTFSIQYWTDANLPNGTTVSFSAVASGATGTQFNAVTSNTQTATNLAAAINSNVSSSLFNATVGGIGSSFVFINVQPGVLSANLTTTATAGNAVASSVFQGTIYFSGNLKGVNTDQNGGGSNPSITNLFNITATGTLTVPTITTASGGNTLALSASNATAGNGSGGNITATAGNSNGTGTAGALTFTAGGGSTTSFDLAGTATLSGGPAGTGSGSVGGTANVQGGTNDSGIGGTTGSLAVGFGVILKGGRGVDSAGTGGSMTVSGGAGGNTTGGGGPETLNGGDATTSGTGGLETVRGGNGAGTDKSSGGYLLSSGTPTGVGTANSDKVYAQLGWTNASGSTAQTMGDRVVLCGHNVTMSNTTATATTICVLNVPTSTSGGGVLIQYFVQASDGTNIDVTTGQFCVSCSNKAGTVTATAGSLTGAASNGNSGSVAAGTISTTIASQAVSIKIAPAYTTIVPTSVTTTINCFAFGKGVTVTAQ